MFSIFTTSPSVLLLDFLFLSKTNPLIKYTLRPRWHCLFCWFDRVICNCLCFNKPTQLNQQQWPSPFSWATPRNQNSTVTSDASVQQILSWEWGDEQHWTPLSFSRNTFQLLLNHFRAKTECWSVEENKTVKQKKELFSLSVLYGVNFQKWKSL